MDKRAEQQRVLLKVVYGVVPIVAGADKFLNLLTDWTQYLPAFVPGLTGMSAATVMAVVGVVEIAAGALVLSKLTRLGGYVVAAWLALIAVTLLLQWRFVDVAVRDLVMAAGALTLARLTEAHAAQGAGAGVAQRQALGAFGG
jgi:hypothetical protein